MLELDFGAWRDELATIVRDVHDCTLAEFWETSELPDLFRAGYSPLEAMEEIEERKLA